MARRPLALHEEVLLLALRDREGTPHPGTWASAAIGGAILGELFLEGHLRTVQDGKKALVEVAGPGGRSGGRLEEGVVRDCLREIADSKKRHPAEHWAGSFGSRVALMTQTAEELCRLGVLKEDERKVLLLFSRKTYPELDPRPEGELLQRIERAIFGSAREVDARTGGLVAVAQQTGLLKAHFDKKRLAAHKARIEEIASGNLVGDAVRGAAEAAQAAFLITTIVPIMTVIH